MMYDERRAQVPSDAIELNATVLPMLIIARPMETMKETMTEFSGMSQPGCTRDRNPPKGTPWSRAKANSWREQVATLFTHPKTAL